MWPESKEKPSKLRSGLTTGCCATACSVAAAQVLLNKKFNPQKMLNLTSVVSVKLPKGKTVILEICGYEILNKSVTACTIKDAGDDPDVTHGAKVFVELTLVKYKGELNEIRFKAGKGVGMVTRAGLSLDVGEPAINPVPRKMISQHLRQLATEYGYDGGFEVAVGIEQGEALALKTMNGRLGIVGGLSVLGTTGIVRPFSCSAYIASIHQGIDVAKKNGFNHIAASTGSSSENAIKKMYSLPDMALIEMGDFVGAVFKYLKKMPVKKLSICAGFGKLSKLANGHLDLHSGASSIDFNHLAELAKQAHGRDELIEKIKLCNTSIEALKYCQAENVYLAEMVCEKALAIARKIVPNEVELEIWAVDRQGNIVANALESDHPLII